jgi:predicted membrane chloride channel (bestrophin family)
MLELKGTVIWRKDILLMGLVEALVCVALQVLIDTGSEYAPNIPNSYALSSLGVVVAFATVFRTQLGWARYWDALGQVHIMYSKWGDVFTQYSVFARTTIEILKAEKGNAVAEEKAQRVLDVYKNVHKHFSLLSALAADRLGHGDVERMNRRQDVGSWGQRVTTRKELTTQNITGSAHVLPVFEGGGMRKSTLNFDHFVEDDGWRHHYAVEEPPSKAEIHALENAHERCNMVMTWILSGLAMTSQDLCIPPPIQSRMYQELSNGMLAYLHNVKIADVPFPFPYAQMLTLLVIIFPCFIPVWVACFTQFLYWANHLLHALSKLLVHQ